MNKPHRGKSLNIPTEQRSIMACAATLGEHQLGAIVVSTDIDTLGVASTCANAREVEIPTQKTARVRFLKKWAREQRRRARNGGIWSLLILPVFASAAMAQSEAGDGIVSTVVQPDGTLLVTFEDGSTVVVPEESYTVSADGQYVIDASVLPGAEAAVGGAAAAGPGALAGVVGAVGVAGGLGGGGGAAAAAATTTGVVLDGYISGATVFRDANGNGVFDDGETSTTTDQQGNFSLGGDTSIPIVAVGGTDVSTGLIFEGTLKAPAGSTVVSPVTTLVQEIIEADDTGETSIESAIATVNAALGLPEDTDLLNADPVADENQELFAAGAKVANIVSIGVANGADEASVVEALAQAIVDAEDDEEPLNDEAIIEDVMTDALDGEPGNSDLAAVAGTLANANNAIDDSDIDEIADVQQVVVGQIADEVEDGTVSEAITQEDIEQAADEAIDVVDGAVTFDTDVIGSDTDLSVFGVEINFTLDSYEVTSGVEFALTMAQADGLVITGEGTVKLVGAFDASVDLSGIATQIDATEVSQFELTVNAAQANVLAIDVAEDASIIVDVDYADLSLDNQSLVPEIDLSGISVNGSNGPVGLFNVLDAGSIEDTFKLLWSYGDNAYYDVLPGGTPEINAANIELGNLYAQYLLDGGAPILDVVQTKVSGEPNYAERQQSLHDNLLGNINDSAVLSRLNSNALDSDNRNDAGLEFGDRPYHDGSLADVRVFGEAADDGGLLTSSAVTFVNDQDETGIQVDPDWGGWLYQIGNGTDGDLQFLLQIDGSVIAAGSVDAETNLFLGLDPELAAGQTVDLFTSDDGGETYSLVGSNVFPPADAPTQDYDDSVALDPQLDGGTLSYVDGSSSDLLATQIWDLANGHARSDFDVGEGEIYVLNGDTVADADDGVLGIQPFTDFSEALAAAGEGAYVVVGSGTYTENQSVVIDGSITIFAEDGAVLEGGLRAETGASESVVSVTGLDIDMAGTNYGIYLNGTDLTLNVTNVDIDGGGSSTSRGIINQSGADPIINVSGGSLTNLQSGSYLNPGATLNIDGAYIAGNTAGIGTDDPAALNITNSTFDGNEEAIGISGDHDNSNVTLSNNDYVTGTDQVLVYFAREDPVAIPGELQDATIVQTVETDTKEDLAVVVGTDGADVIVDNPSETVIDLSAGGSDFVILTLDGASDGYNQILNFTAGSAEGSDILAFRYEDGTESGPRGQGVETLAEGAAIGADTGFVIFTTELAITSSYEEIASSGLQAGELSEILSAADSLENGDDGSVVMAVSNGDDTLVFSVDLDENATDADRVIDLAHLENVATQDLTADNLFDFSSVAANT
ncbi:hypothetical protein [uncultured Tateyamaria sp.]|uniref:hypothetical protein n=1 Tax=uncultured Tateyamaria sp. TaxID=455651 RepID=UPI00262D5EE3|nr:hypothetical protein [uncultured Tateyamaria sp.]